MLFPIQRAEDIDLVSEFMLAEYFREWTTVQVRDDAWLVVQEEFEVDRVHVEEVRDAIGSMRPSGGAGVAALAGGAFAEVDIAAVGGVVRAAVGAGELIQALAVVGAGEVKGTDVDLAVGVLEADFGCSAGLGHVGIVMG